MRGLPQLSGESLSGPDRFGGGRVCFRPFTFGAPASLFGSGGQGIRLGNSLIGLGVHRLDLRGGIGVGQGAELFKDLPEVPHQPFCRSCTAMRPEPRRACGSTSLDNGRGIVAFMQAESAAPPLSRASSPGSGR